MLDGGRLVVAHAGHQGGLPGSGVRPGPGVLPLRRHDRRDRRVRPAGALPVGRRLPRRGDRRLWTHADHRRRSGSTTRSASTPAACSAGGSPRCATPSGSSCPCPAQREHYAPVRPLAPPAAAARPGDLLDVADVLSPSRLHLDTGYGRIPIDPPQAAAALEVMGRFACRPAAGCATCRRRWRRRRRPPWTVTSNTRRRLRRLPRAGVTRLVCEEKHMGSRAIVLVCRDDAAARRFGPGRLGAVYTRTGRPFFPDALTTALARPGACGGDRGRAVGRPRHRLAPARRRAAAVVGQGGRADPRAVRGGRRGRLPRRCQPTLEVLDRAAARAGWTWRRCASGRRPGGQRRALHGGVPPLCAPTDGLDGVTLAPFAVLAAEGANLRGPRQRLAPRRRPTGWSRPTRRCSRRRTAAWSTSPTPATVAAADALVGRAHRPRVARAWSSSRTTGWCACPAAGSPSRGSSAAAASTCGSSTGPTTPRRSNSPGCASATSGRKRGAGAARARARVGGAGSGRRRRAALAGARAGVRRAGAGVRAGRPAPVEHGATRRSREEDVAPATETFLGLTALAGRGRAWAVRASAVRPRAAHVTRRSWTYRLPYRANR